MSSIANTDDDIIDLQLLNSSELPIISPSLPEALGHLDNLITFFQSISISTLVLSSISDLLYNMSQEQERLKHYQRTKMIQTSLKNFWSSGLANQFSMCIIFSVGRISVRSGLHICPV